MAILKHTDAVGWIFSLFPRAEEIELRPRKVLAVLLLSMCVTHATKAPEARFRIKVKKRVGSEAAAPTDKAWLR